MKKTPFILSIIALVCVIAVTSYFFLFKDTPSGDKIVLPSAPGGSTQDEIITPPSDVIIKKPYIGDIAVAGSWTLVKSRALPETGDTLPVISRIPSRTFFVSTGMIPDSKDMISYGGMLYPKFSPGLSFQ